MFAWQHHGVSLTWYGSPCKIQSTKKRGQSAVFLIKMIAWPDKIRYMSMSDRRNEMNTTVKKNAFLKRIAKTPLLKLLSRTMNVIRNNDPRKKQPIIRQGAPECFEENSPLKIEWSLTSYCNYRCSYCFRAGKGYEKIFCSLEQAETAIKHIASANRPSYQVSLHGGEPTSHPQLANIITLLC